MPEFSREVERFVPASVDGRPGIVQADDGSVVRYSDYEKAARERDALADIVSAAAGNLVNSANPRKIAERLWAPDAIGVRLREMDEEDHEAAIERRAEGQKFARKLEHRDAEMRKRILANFSRIGIHLDKAARNALDRAFEEAGLVRDSANEAANAEEQ